MKYIVKAEIAVYEGDGDMDDIVRLNLSASSTSLETARTMGEELDNAVREIFRKRRAVQPLSQPLHPDLSLKVG